MTHGDNTQQTREHTAHNIKADKIRKREALEGFYRRLETAMGKYTLLSAKRKYEGARHVKQTYNSRLTIQTQKKNHNRRKANYIYNILIFCQKVSIF